MDPNAAIPLILITLGAIIVPGVARQVAIPVAVMEIAFGLLIGNTGLGIVPDVNDPFISFLSVVGFAFFLFLAGLEIDFRGVEGRGLKGGIMPVAVSTLAFVMSMGVSIHQGWGMWVGLATGATSVPLLLAVVRELRLSSTSLGTTMITFAAVGEALTIVFLSLVEIQQHAHNLGDIAVGIGRLLGLVVVMVVVVQLLRALLWWYPHLFTRLVAHDDPSEVGVRVGFGLMFSFVGLSMLAHVEPFLGAFIAGAILSFVIREKGALEHKLSSMGYGFFIPVFFINVGIQLTLTADLVLTNIGWIFSLIALMLLAKLIPGSLLLLRGLSIKEVAATAGLLAAPLTLVIAIMDIGHRFGAVDDTTRAVVITAGIIASLLFPSFARKLLKDTVPDEPAEHAHV
ncbi:MAG: Kef-type K+ transport system membrane component KefB [Myxococcota bacterium]|jgi:Kef-type K+ transport system membrane component KefB